MDRFTALVFSDASIPPNLPLHHPVPTQRILMIIHNLNMLAGINMNNERKHQYSPLVHSSDFCTTTVYYSYSLKNVKLYIIMASVESYCYHQPASAVPTPADMSTWHKWTNQLNWLKWSFVLIRLNVPRSPSLWFQDIMCLKPQHFSVNFIQFVWLCQWTRGVFGGIHIQSAFHQ